jgi:hypothetical protein
VVRYYTDRSGFVTAMDVQTEQGVQMVHFSPSMGERLYTMYPVGGTAQVYVTGQPMMGTMRYDLAGVGENMPSAQSMQSPYMTKDLDLLEAQPYMMAGAQLETVKGTLKNMLTNERGEVVGLILAKGMVNGKKINQMSGGTVNGSNSGNMGGGTTGAMGSTDATMGAGSTTGGNDTTTTGGTTTDTTTMGGTTTDTTTTTTDTTTVTGGGLMGGGMMASDMVLVRVPREFRHINPGAAGEMGVTPLFKGSRVEVTGYPEAPRFGTLSAYGQRISAQAIVVNGRSVGALGFPLMPKSASKSLIKLNLGGTKSPEEMKAMGMGYSTYDPMGTMSSTSSATTGGTDTGTMGGGMDSGTGGTGSTGAGTDTTGGMTGGGATTGGG